MSERPEIGNPSLSPKSRDKIPGDLVIAQKGHGDWLRRGQLQVIPSFGPAEDTLLSERIHRRRSKHFPPLLVRSSALKCFLKSWQLLSKNILMERTV